MQFPVDLHTHTVASYHAYSTIVEYVHQAKLCGIKMFATTDHGPSLEDAPHVWHFGNLKVVPRTDLPNSKENPYSEDKNPPKLE